MFKIVSIEDLRSTEVLNLQLCRFVSNAEENFGEVYKNSEIVVGMEVEESDQ